MMTVTLVNGRSFSSERGTTILDSAIAQGIALEHSCRTGRCGSCKAQVVSGSATVLREATSLTAIEAAEGWVLTCAHEATTDLRLDIEDLTATAGIAVKTVPARIDNLERLAPDVLQIDLRLPPRSNFRFLAGQYVDLTSPDGVKRSYSLSSDALATDRLQLQVRRVQGGQLSDYWFNKSRVNDLLRFNGPRGTFFLRSVAGIDVVFLATGTGIAPIKAMLLGLSRLAPEEQPASTTLYWGGRTREDLYWTPTEAWPGLNYVPILSRGHAEWAGARGHVQDVMLSASPGLDNIAVYACGSETMTRSARTALLAAGLPAKRFFADAFVSSSPSGHAEASKAPSTTKAP